MKINISASDVQMPTVGVNAPKCQCCGAALNQWGDPHDVGDCIKRLAEQVRALQARFGMEPE